MLYHTAYTARVRARSTGHAAADHSRSAGPPAWRPDLGRRVLAGRQRAHQLAARGQQQGRQRVRQGLRRGGGEPGASRSLWESLARTCETSCAPLRKTTKRPGTGVLQGGPMWVGIEQCSLAARDLGACIVVRGPQSRKPLSVSGLSPPHLRGYEQPLRRHHGALQARRGARADLTQGATALVSQRTSQVQRPHCLVRLGLPPHVGGRLARSDAVRAWGGVLPWRSTCPVDAAPTRDGPLPTSALCERHSLHSHVMSSTQEASRERRKPKRSSACRGEARADGAS